jgi:hypothetical protein
MHRTDPTTEAPTGPARPQPPGEEPTGLPGLPTWRGVYLVVAGSFGLWVALLWGLSHLFA